MSEPDPAHPERYPAVYARTQCAVCDKCWLDLRMARCITMGPYPGYANAAPADALVDRSRYHVDERLAQHRADYWTPP